MLLADCRFHYRQRTPAFAAPLRHAYIAAVLSAMLLLFDMPPLDTLPLFRH